MLTTSSLWCSNWPLTRLLSSWFKIHCLYISLKRTFAGSIILTLINLDQTIRVFVLDRESIEVVGGRRSSRALVTSVVCTLIILCDKKLTNYNKRNYQK